MKPCEHPYPLTVLAETAWGTVLWCQRCGAFCKRPWTKNKDARLYWESPRVEETPREEGPGWKRRVVETAVDKVTGDFNLAQICAAIGGGISRCYISYVLRKLEKAGKLKIANPEQGRPARRYIKAWPEKKPLDSPRGD